MSCCVCVSPTVVAISERGEPERERETQEEVEMGEKEGTRVPAVCQTLERGVETLSSWPHPEISHQLSVCVVFVHVCVCVCGVCVFVGE